MIITNLLTNMVVLALNGYIPAVTPAFEDCAFQAAFTNALSLGDRWHLDQGLITSSALSGFAARARPRQIQVNMEFGGRYQFGTTQAGFLFFSDSAFSEASLLSSMDREAFAHRYGGPVEAWAAPTNRLTLEAAQTIAESAMRAYGVPIRDMGFLQPAVREQSRRGDRVLPFYKFEWRSGRGRCSVHVSGVNANVVYFEFEGGEQLRLKPPANYLQLLGLPSNATFVKPRADGTFELFGE